MKKFCDLHLRLPLNDFDLAERMIGKSSMLGYSKIGIPLPVNVSDDTVSKLQQICSDVGIDFVSRVNLVPKNANEVLVQLRRFRRKFEIISISCQSKPVARQAAKDRRVDLISFSSSDFRKRFFDQAEAELATSALASLEISMFSLLSASSFERTRLLSSLRREVDLAENFSVPVIVSSGAISEFFMRAPREFAVFCHLFDMPFSVALAAVSKNPVAIISRNRAKFSSKHVAPGIRVIRRGKDCEE